MFLTVDYGGPFTGFVMKETRGVKENHVFHCKDLHIESETQSYLQALCCRRTLECYKLCYFKSNFLTSGWKMRCRIFEMGHHRQDSEPFPRPPQRYTDHSSTTLFGSKESLF